MATPTDTKNSLEQDETQKTPLEELVEVFREMKDYAEELKRLRIEDPERYAREALEAADEMLAAASPWPEGESRVGQTIAVFMAPSRLPEE